MSKKFFGMILLLFGTFFLVQGTLSADTIGDLRWNGSDLLARFSDSVSYTIDLAASDSSQLVVRFRDVTIPAGFPTSLSGRGRSRAMQAIVTTIPPNELRLTVHSEGRLGYVTLWRPYSRTFVVHTFDWNGLDYATEQYYKGLLALEQGLNDHAVELLSIAEATGDARAASVLGTYYAKRGEYRTAEQYLDKPNTADDYAALADVKRRAGDSAAAARNQEKADELMARGREGEREREEEREREGPASVNDDSFETNEMIRDRERLKWLYVGGGVLLVLLLVALIVWFGRRSRQSDTGYRDIPPQPQPQPQPQTPPPPTEAEWEEVHETRERQDRPTPISNVVEAREVVTERDDVIDLPQADAEALRTVEHTEIARTPDAAATHSTPSQAADLRRRIEEMRARTEPHTPPPATSRMEPHESTIAEARRLQLSRDSVELRRRLERMKRL